PNPADAARGLEAGLITRRQHRQIVERVRAGGCPPWNTALGGEVFIHGSGSATDWTWGCVALDDDDIRELFPRIPVGTPFVIEP
ncbi:MAG TPA: L,D-transpeptidase, partial [Thermoanaerobaculia bacterium]|nr:L,D-transpeptidase [Thermoanaerobaculia bacterium]